MGLAHSSSIRVITDHPVRWFVSSIGDGDGAPSRHRGTAPHLTGRKTTRVLVHLAGFLSMLCSSASSCVVPVAEDGKKLRCGEIDNI
jgi:hypothetical protein